MIRDWYSITLTGLQELWEGFLVFLPRLVGALVVFLIGWVVSVAIGRLVVEILQRLQFNQLFERGTWKQALEKAGLKVHASEFVGGIVKWVLLIVFVLAAVEILGFKELAVLLQRVLGYLPNVLVASAIFVITVIIADIVEKVLRTLVEGAQMGYGHTVTVIVRWSIWIFATIIILEQLGVARNFLQTLYTGIVALIVLAGGIAFGLGGKEVAADLLREWRDKLKG